MVRLGLATFVLLIITAWAVFSTKPVPSSLVPPQTLMGPIDARDITVTLPTEWRDGAMITVEGPDGESFCWMSSDD